MADPESLDAIRDGVRGLCAGYGDTYWRGADARKGFPETFVKAMTEVCWLAGMIPEAYDGSGLGLAEASVIGGHDFAFDAGLRPDSDGAVPARARRLLAQD